MDDVAHGHLLALNKGRIGERYILGGEDVFLSQMLADIAGMVGRKPPTVNLPRAVVYPVAFFAQLAARFTGNQPFATIDGIRMSRYRMFFSDRRRGPNSVTRRGPIARACPTRSTGSGARDT